jgi:hypothetical protein
MPMVVLLSERVRWEELVKTSHESYKICAASLVKKMNAQFMLVCYMLLIYAKPNHGGEAMELMPKLLAISKQSHRS